MEYDVYVLRNIEGQYLVKVAEYTSSVYGAKPFKSYEQAYKFNQNILNLCLEIVPAKL